ncbi:MAG: RNA-dependent DNA polymerase [Dechloromonas sp.]|nr:MAG: RNA-dependent DNA polymerase [Dechloromonas sp.]
MNTIISSGIDFSGGKRGGAGPPGAGASEAYHRLCAWENLLAACGKAARGKRGRRAAATFEYQFADRLLAIKRDLTCGSYRPGPYVHFTIAEPKRRKISAAPFADRVVHHALCRIIEPRFERLFIADSYANRVGKGIHRAVDRLQQFAQRYDYVLRADIVKHFPSIDHAILRQTLAGTIPEDDVLALVDHILESGAGVLDDEYPMVYYPGDDLLAACRPRGLPIGNLTSQFWSNCYLHPFDQFVTRELRCRAYLRYVDDFALFSNSKRELWAWKRALVERLARLRLTIHEHATQVLPTACGIPWLGFVVHPGYRLVKAHKVRAATGHLGERLDDYRAGRISFGELDASVKGWVNHIRYADSWGLRRHVFRGLRFQMRPPTAADAGFRLS